MNQADSAALSRIATHEAVCAVRYESIDWKLTVIFHIFAWGGGSLICSMAFLIYHLVVRSP